ncbi:MAG TPA: hypothetical protein DE191_10185, partial [Enterobacter sp.]|nr:hypothetical protein [Enterobacter sp.]
MATLDDDLAKAVTEGFRQAQIDIVNQDLILSGTDDVTVTLADGSKKTGPSWSKLSAQAMSAGDSAAAAATSATNAKTSETNANSAKTAAATSASNAKTSETNAKTSETNAKTSENNAKTSETNAAASLAAAQQLTSVPYEAAPFPDVWAPLNDDLRLLAGSAPYDKLTISGQVLELPTKSMTFTRSTIATYIDKSGVLKTAAVNEPRFEREGLLMEGQSTNYVLNSNDPSLWLSNGTLTKGSIVDGTTQAVTYTGTVNAATSANHQATVSSNITVDAGEAVTISARAKASSDIVRFRFTLDGTDIANIFFNALTGELISATTGLTYTTSLGSDGYAYLSATYTAPSAGVVTAGVWLRGNANLPVGTVIYIQTLQVEKNPVATSYIPTTGSAVTRSADNCVLQPSCNVGYRTVGDAFNRTVSLELTVNSMGLTGSNYNNVLAAAGVSSDLMLRLFNTNIRAYRSNVGPILNVTYPFTGKIYTQTIDAANKMTLYMDSASNSNTAAPSTPASTPTSIVFGTSPAVVY